MEISTSSSFFFFLQYDQIKQVLIIMKRGIYKLLAWYESLFDGLFQARIEISKQLIPSKAVPKNHRGGKKSLTISFMGQFHRLKSYHLRIHSIGNFHLEDSKLLEILQNWKIDPQEEVCDLTRLSLALYKIRKINRENDFISLFISMFI